MTASVSFIFGILLGAIVLVFANRRGPDAGLPASKPTTLGWLTLAFGLTAAAAFAAAAWLTTGSEDHGSGLWLISIAFGFAAVVDGVGTIMKRDRHWPTWAGLVSGLAPAVFWIAFAAAHILGFGD